jgi:hypothetical protein
MRSKEDLNTDLFEYNAGNEGHSRNKSFISQSNAARKEPFYGEANFSRIAYGSGTKKNLLETSPRQIDSSRRSRSLRKRLNQKIQKEKRQVAGTGSSEDITADTVGKIQINKAKNIKSTASNLKIELKKFNDEKKEQSADANIKMQFKILDSSRKSSRDHNYSTFHSDKSVSQYLLPKHRPIKEIYVPVKVNKIRYETLNV